MRRPAGACRKQLEKLIDQYRSSGTSSNTRGRNPFAAPFFFLSCRLMALPFLPFLEDPCILVGQYDLSCPEHPFDLQR
jgi:hypothetical protein